MPGWGGAPCIDAYATAMSSTPSPLRSATAHVEYEFHWGMLFKTTEVDGPQALKRSKAGNRTAIMTAERQNRDMAGLLQVAGDLFCDFHFSIGRKGTSVYRGTSRSDAAHEQFAGLTASAHQLLHFFFVDDCHPQLFRLI